LRLFWKVPNIFCFGYRYLWFEILMIWNKLFFTYSNLTADRTLVSVPQSQTTIHTRAGIWSRLVVIVPVFACEVAKCALHRQQQCRCKRINTSCNMAQVSELVHHGLLLKVVFLMHERHYFWPYRIWNIFHCVSLMFLFLLYIRKQNTSVWHNARQEMQLYRM